MNKKQVKLKDIALRAEVSVATVSAALNGTGRISDRLREHITAVARQMNYEPNLAAKLLKQKHCSDIALVISDYTKRIVGSGFFQPMIYQFILLCDAEGIRCQVEYHDPGTKDDQVPEIMTNGLAGGVLYGGAVGTATRKWLKENPNFPFVVFEDSAFEYAIHSRYDLAAYQALQHLAALGHRRVGLLGGPPRYEVQAGLQQGFARAVADFGLDDGGGRWSHEFALKFDADTMREGVAWCSELFDGGSYPSALLATDARLAKAVMYASLKRGIEIPRDLSLISCSNESESEQVYPLLSAIRWNAEEAVFKAYHLLRARMDGRQPPERHIEVEPIFTMRDSVGRCPGGK